MRDPLATRVHSVLTYGLDLLSRVWAGEQPDIDIEQAILKNLLLADKETRAEADFAGDLPPTRGDLGTRTTDPRHDPNASFLGIRYALVCWLDELFTSDSDWGIRWNERKLEVELYGSNDRAWRFWEQAQLAHSRTNTDALEAYYLCVTLGFRGQLRDQPDQLRSWIAAAQHRVGDVQEIQWPWAAQLEPAVYAPPLRGRESMQRMVFTGWTMLLLLIPLVAFALARRLGS